MHDGRAREQTESIAADAKRRADTRIVAGGRAKLRLAKDRHEAALERYVDRAEAIRIGAQEAEYFLAELSRTPARNADTFAAQVAGAAR